MDSHHLNNPNHPNHPNQSSDLTTLAGLTRATTADAPRIAAMLARAFQDDPAMRYAIPDAGARRKLLPRLISLNVRYGCRYGEVYITPGYEGAAVWLPPGQTTMTLWRVLRAGMLSAPLRISWPVLWRLNTMGACAAIMHERYAPGPHWYLSQLGVEPAQQRQGIAARLIRPMLARIDATGALPCYLETEREANLAIYQRYGFRVVGEDATPGGGPRVWALLRAGRGSGAGA